ncbi:polysaccharide biosynthesis/export family protein [Cellulophaga sp. 20_2_10]|uniref:polysaccharide biosynthesis/export family protein n=1 Tax=Cellulophaga sp. 20_2_10 TaxID=2942476 RepID=UPI00201B1447|nr:polysaccharide biosynthesis/export family protein [Cellulophaga sp. 20_2_10]MCL5244774.1 polysaccharide biosynthesis/export family protein [Cellulophaga sp. 20_2_10]
MKTIQSILNKVLPFFIIAILFSCASKKDVVYFQNLSAFETMVATETYTPRLKVGDKVALSITSENPIASAPFNMSTGVTASGEQATAGMTYYLVDVDGNITLPVLGVQQVKGMSIPEVKASVRSKLIDGGLLKDPQVIVALDGFNITVLGQVRSPGTFYIPGQRITVLQALGLAGDLDITGNRSNVLVMRDFNGTKVSTRIDLTRKEVLNSPVYYLTQNDVIYVEPNQSKINESKSSNRALTLSVASLLLTLTTTVVVLLRN